MWSFTESKWTWISPHCWWRNISLSNETQRRTERFTWAWVPLWVPSVSVLTLAFLWHALPECLGFLGVLLEAWQKAVEKCQRLYLSPSPLLSQRLWMKCSLMKSVHQFVQMGMRMSNLLLLNMFQKLNRHVKTHQPSILSFIKHEMGIFWIKSRHSSWN